MSITEFYLFAEAIVSLRAANLVSHNLAASAVNDALNSLEREAEPNDPA